MGEELSILADSLEKVLKEEKVLREKIKKCMQEERLKKFETAAIKLYYYAPTTRISVSGKKLKAKYPKIYDELSIETGVKAFIKAVIKD